MNKVTVIAEAGVNHNGSLQMALQLVDAAADAGADIVKFQTFKASKLVSAQAKKARYQQANLPDQDDSQLSMLKKLELSREDFEQIIGHCNRRGIRFLSTPFDIESVDMLARLGVDTWKIPSGEVTNFPLLRKIASMNGDVIMSTGMCSIDEVEAAISVLERFGTPRSRITLLHCTTQYPAPLDSVNLLAMDSLRSLGCHAVGYSDHTAGILVPVAAAARGAAVIEKHFTLDRNLPGPDHKASLIPHELQQMVLTIRDVETALGSAEKGVTEAERGNVSVARKSIVAAKKIAAGEVFTEDNLTCKRPGDGISPMLWESVVGRKAPRAFAADEKISL
ncbi:MAG: N-acetylneuraminate synthase [Muribaculaceae bacterium]|nr:N-acetylneuraminate synthase [Muribaculaceae bacterium]